MSPDPKLRRALENTRAEEEAAFDLEVVAASYRALTEPAAFEDLMDAWNRKLASMPSGEDWSEQDLSRGLASHLAQVEEIAGRSPMQNDDPIRAAVETQGQAAMVQSPDGRIVAMNLSAETVFGSVAGALDTFSWLDPASQAELSAIRHSAATNGNRERAILRLADADDQAISLAEARVLRLRNADRGFVAITRLGLPWTASVGAVVSETFSLTAAELEVLRHFYECRDLQSVADMRGASLATVRTQFKTILAKTGAGSQARLLHILAMLCAREMAESHEREMAWSDPFSNERIIRRRSGKRLAYSSVGNPAGQPVLWVHGPGFNGIPPQRLIDDLLAAGKYLIFICRPGYGHSDSNPNIAPEEDQVSALVDFCEALDLQHCLAVGTTSGTQALHLARDRVPDRIGTIVAISFSWKATREEVDRLPVMHRTMYRLARRAPSILRSLCTLGLRLVHHHGPDWYVQRAHEQSAFNRDCLRNPETQALLRSDCRMMLAHGSTGFVADLMLAYADTAPALERSNAPTLWLMGDRDQHFGTIDRVCSTSPGLTLRVLEGCSELMLYQRPDLVAQGIIDAAEMD